MIPIIGDLHIHSKYSRATACIFDKNRILFSPDYHGIFGTAKVFCDKERLTAM